VVSGLVIAFLVLLDDLQGSADGSGGVLVVAALLVLVGLGVAAGGVWRLATNVDLAARVAADVLSRAESAAVADQA
jgi:hypothetical protein